MTDALPITMVGTPVLHQPCQPVERFDDDLARLVETMFASMYAARGVGLAANQIGVDQRVFVYDCPDQDDVLHKGVVVNPVLRLPGIKHRRLDEGTEGCLSIPGCSAQLARPDRAVCDGSDVTGAPVTVHGTGLLARCLQHETDHLDGLLYIDRLPAAARRSVLAEHDQRRKAST
ncbi:peptide deformylase [Nonomuraea sp. NPDC003709]|uniref:peptide deformylase n=1 Tax=Nonomuraea sp. NPDC003709 TaxID=3154450 RepID=UPI0033BE1E3E